ncbi:hypothetical protein BO94DRAFT_548160 [Aspergillus sclerotioniger CBS 115572]|uniref:BTB domain-containing protein n=1 Tax=Aspergillus sclerotioniger CBS 115572 TaxID=1450535 RepID=A0A317W2P1_9EURO|nr:hypothetical protein BO94DRAFT_548160 [Aspergillus sclerotioniger CBS 115572]PWY80864.1 hypothetical protein BO94DRAFT_548160 [Aspergillus sclerotioniger CBS 115572]
MTIVTKDREFKAHKIILGSQSNHFSRMFQRPWKETKENLIDLHDDDPAIIEEMLRFMYGFSYTPRSDTIPPLLFHVKAYRIGDKYEIPGLKDAAKRTFVKDVKRDWKSDAFVSAIKEAYTTTMPTDRGIRDPLVNIAMQHIDTFMQEEEFKRALRETVGFGCDLFQVQYDQAKSQQAKRAIYECNTCGCKFSMDCTHAAGSCPSCYRRSLHTI